MWWCIPFFLLGLIGSWLIWKFFSKGANQTCEHKVNQLMTENKRLRLDLERASDEQNELTSKVTDLTDENAEYLSKLAETEAKLSDMSSAEKSDDAHISLNTIDKSDASESNDEVDTFDEVADMKKRVVTDSFENVDDALPEDNFADIEEALSVNIDDEEATSVSKAQSGIIGATAATLAATTGIVYASNKLSNEVSVTEEQSDASEAVISSDAINQEQKDNESVDEDVTVTSNVNVDENQTHESSDAQHDADTDTDTDTDTDADEMSDEEQTVDVAEESTFKSHKENEVDESSDIGVDTFSNDNDSVGDNNPVSTDTSDEEKVTQASNNDAISDNVPSAKNVVDSSNSLHGFTSNSLAEKKSAFLMGVLGTGAGLSIAANANAVNENEANDNETIDCNSLVDSETNGDAIDSSIIDEVKHDSKDSTEANSPDNLTGTAHYTSNEMSQVSSPTSYIAARTSTHGEQANFGAKTVTTPYGNEYQMKLRKNQENDNELDENSAFSNNQNITHDTINNGSTLLDNSENVALQNADELDETATDTTTNLTGDSASDRITARYANLDTAESSELDSNDMVASEKDSDSQSGNTGLQIQNNTDVIGFDKSAAKSAMGKTIKEDDLKVVEGIGPKIAKLFHAEGVTTWQALSETPVDICKDILTAAGSRFKMHDPSTWPEQAGLAAKGEWEALADLQDNLKGGRKV